MILKHAYTQLHAVPNHTRRMKRFEYAGPEEEALLRSWRASGALWVTRPGADDDWYWMYATALLGAHVRVLTNDEMRNHHGGLRERYVKPQRRHTRSVGVDVSGSEQLPSWFARWKARHVIRFDFSHGAEADRPLPALLLRLPTAYSSEVQRGARPGQWHLPAAAADRGSPSSEWLSVSRSAADDEPPAEWLCVDVGGG